MNKYYHRGNGEVVTPEIKEPVEADYHTNKDRLQWHKGYPIDQFSENGFRADRSRWKTHLDTLEVVAYCDPSYPVGWLPECEERYKRTNGIGLWNDCTKEQYDETFPHLRKIFLVPVTEEYYDQYQITHLFPDNLVITTKEIYDDTPEGERRIVRAKVDEKIPVSKKEPNMQKIYDEIVWRLNKNIKIIIEENPPHYKHQIFDVSKAADELFSLFKSAPVETLPKGEPEITRHPLETDLHFEMRKYRYLQALKCGCDRCQRIISETYQAPKGEDEPAGNQIFRIYKNMPDSPLKTFLSQWFSKYDPDAKGEDEQDAIQCMESGCDRKATKDYNGHGHWVCDKCYDRLNDYFEDNYS